MIFTKKVRKKNVFLYEKSKIKFTLLNMKDISLRKIKNTVLRSFYKLDYNNGFIVVN